MIKMWFLYEDTSREQPFVQERFFPSSGLGSIVNPSNKGMLVANAKIM